MTITQFPIITKREGVIYEEKAPAYTENTPKETYVIFNIDETEEITLFSEPTLHKIWMTPEEDEAWKDL